jgi:hypothetical protein
VNGTDHSIVDAEIRWEAALGAIGADVSIEPPDPARTVDLAELPELRAQLIGQSFTRVPVVGRHRHPACRRRDALQCVSTPTRGRYGFLIRYHR